ncbi:hypothetical protein NECID01_1904 [Nematocida sp. AWRm77]|nr:hypothetical protein NECID01_1904 [Nematocida sp. AWRm77]
MIDILSNMRTLRSLEIASRFLNTGTVEYLLEKLPSLECLSVGAYEMDNKLAHALSKCASMHTLKVKGNYIPGFLASLMQPSPLMSTLKVLTVWRNPNVFRDNFTLEDKHSKKSAMKNFGCAIQIIY